METLQLEDQTQPRDVEKSKSFKKEKQKEEGTDEKMSQHCPSATIQDGGTRNVRDVDGKASQSKKLKLYSRCWERKTFFIPQKNSSTTSDLKEIAGQTPPNPSRAPNTTSLAQDIQTPASYFLLNPRGNKHASEWRPHLYLGDNPKYPQYSSSSVGGSRVDGCSRVYGRARRTWLWSSFSVEIGEGIEMEVANKKVRIETKKRRRIAWWRRKLGMKEKTYEEGPGEEKEVRGRVVKIEVVRGAWGRGDGGWRVLSWSLSGSGEKGEEYRWMGSRGEKKSAWRGRMKGVGHGLKLVRICDGKILATFTKSHFSALNKTERLGVPPNKKRIFVGILELFTSSTSEALPTLETGAAIEGSLQRESRNFDETGKEVLLNEEELLEMAIVFTGWIAAEAEHRLRHKLWDLIVELQDYLVE